MHCYAPLQHSMSHVVRTVCFLRCHPLFIATMEQREKDWGEGYRRQLREGGPEPRAEGAPKTPSARGTSVLTSLVCLFTFCHLYIFFCSCSPFCLLSFTFVCLHV